MADWLNEGEAAASGGLSPLPSPGRFAPACRHATLSALTLAASLSGCGNLDGMIQGPDPTAAVEVQAESSKATFTVLKNKVFTEGMPMPKRDGGGVWVELSKTKLSLVSRWINADALDN